MKWSAVGWGFLITCFAATIIDQNYLNFGIRICDQMPDELRRDCIDFTKKEVRKGFNALAISIWVLSTIAISSYIDE